MSRRISPMVGLCALCQHVKLITSARGSHFIMCQAAKDDDRLPKYPTLPVLECVGFSYAPQPQEEDASEG